MIETRHRCGAEKDLIGSFVCIENDIEICPLADYAGRVLAFVASRRVVLALC